MKIQVYTLNAFGKSETGGNAAGVVLNSDHLTEEMMKNIAKKVGFSETAFVQKSDVADFKVRFFTPTDEVDLCGHATIATFYVLGKEKIVKPGIYTQETKAGVLNIEIQPDLTILMNQSTPEFYDTIDKAELADSLNISVDELDPTLPAQIVSTGLKDILIPIKYLDTLLSMKPDFDKITALSKKYNVIGYHAFTQETEFDSTAHCRNFAPLYDIPEESATGTSNGALSAYLYKHKVLNDSNVDHLVFEQGYSMKQDSEIEASLIIENGIIAEVKVGGKASNLAKITITI